VDTGHPDSAHIISGPRTNKKMVLIVALKSVRAAGLHCRVLRTR